MVGRPVRVGAGLGDESVRGNNLAGGCWWMVDGGWWMMRAHTRTLAHTAHTQLTHTTRRRREEEEKKKRRRREERGGESIEGGEETGVRMDRDQLM